MFLHRVESVYDAEGLGCGGCGWLRVCGWGCGCRWRGVGWLRVWMAGGGGGC